MTPVDRREVGLLAAIAVVSIALLLAYFAGTSSTEFTAGLVVGIPAGVALGLAIDALLRWLVDSSNARHRGRQ